MENQQLSEELARIVVTTWDMMVHLQAEPLDKLPEDFKTSKTYVSTVHINGDWLGSVTLECNCEHGIKVAQSIFELTQNAISTEMIDEAMRELVNMTGGNIKSVLGANCVMSVPKMLDGIGFQYSLPETNELARQYFKIGSDYLCAKVYHSLLNPSEVKTVS